MKSSYRLRLLSIGMLLITILGTAFTFTREGTASALASNSSDTTTCSLSPAPTTATTSTTSASTTDTTSTSTTKAKHKTKTKTKHKAKTKHKTKTKTKHKAKTSTTSSDTTAVVTPDTTTSDTTDTTTAGNPCLTPIPSPTAMAAQLPTPTPSPTAMAAQLPTPTPSPTATPIQTPPPTTTTQSSTSSTTQPGVFKGTYVFSGGNNSTYADNPYIAGTFLGYYWSQLEPQEGQYNWSIIDNDMKPWVDHGKNVIIRLSTAGWTNWQPPVSGKGTPQWVYAKGVSYVTEADKSILPQYWNPTFIQSLGAFVQAFASRYDGNPHITAVEIGVGVGGETKVDSYNSNPNLVQQWQAIGYTNAIWWNAVQQIINLYISSFHKTPLVVMPDKTFIVSESGYSESMVVDYAVSHNLWLQENGVGAGSTLAANSPWRKVPVVAEQRDPTSQSGDTLQQDLQAGITNMGASYFLVFASDISANQSALQWAASQVH